MTRIACGKTTSRSVCILGQADRAGRLDLAAADGLDPAAHHLADERRGVEHQADEQRRELRRNAPRRRLKLNRSRTGRSNDDGRTAAANQPTTASAASAPRPTSRKRGSGAAAVSRRPAHDEQATTSSHGRSPTKTAHSPKPPRQPGAGTKRPRWLRKTAPAGAGVSATAGSWSMTAIDENELHQQRRVAHQLDVAGSDAAAPASSVDSRATPTRTPSSVARTMPTTLTKSVLRRPTRNALP